MDQLSETAVNAVAELARATGVQIETVTAPANARSLPSRDMDRAARETELPAYQGTPEMQA